MSNLISVIDIGSNSIRIVIYDTNTIIPSTKFDAKVLCGLSKNINETNRLNSSGKELAIRSIERFILLSQHSKCEKAMIVATSAVRESNDGEEFVEMLENKYAIKIKILSPEEETKYSFMGLMYSINPHSGIMGDLGGGSLELANIHNQNITSQHSLAIGAIRSNLLKNNNEIRNNEILLEQCIQEPTHENKTFYAIGGGFRNIAKAYISLNNHPIHVAHNLEINDITNLKKTCEHIINCNDVLFDESKNQRGQSLSNAAIILQSIIKIINPQKIIFCGYGLREGIMYQELLNDGKISKSDDILLLGCKALSSDNSTYGDDLYQFLKYIVSDEEYQRIKKSACLLSEISSTKHKQYRAEYAFNDIIESRLMRITHRERAILAMALFYSYKSKISQDFIGNIENLVEKNDKRCAKKIGYGIRLGRNLTGGGAMNILNTKILLEISDNTLILKVSDDIKAIVCNDNIEKLMKKLAKQCDIYYRIDFFDTY